MLHSPVFEVALHRSKTTGTTDGTLGVHMNGGNEKLHINVSDKVERAVQGVIARTSLPRNQARRVWARTKELDALLAGRPLPSNGRRPVHA